MGREGHATPATGNPDPGVGPTVGTPASAARADITGLLKSLIILIPAVPAVVALFKLLRVAQGDDATLKTLLSTLDVPAAFLGSLAPALPLICVVFFAFVAFKALSGSEGDAAGLPGFVYSLAGTACFLTALFLPLSYVALLIVLPLVGVAIHAIFHPRRMELRRTLVSEVRSSNFVFVAAGFPLLITIFGSGSMWLPAEHLHIEGEQPRVGYVLKVEDGLHTILYKDSTEVVRIPQDKVEHRIICGETAKNWYGTPIFALSNEPADTPRCP